ncbi:hypothetical protein BDZ91DRAFT_560897 [Kalaharituber pfeilii]|nr:hypothetical protein BDZ91DRAFT_560897 [Kalaharituber pfeilii]
MGDYIWGIFLYFFSFAAFGGNFPLHTLVKGFSLFETVRYYIRRKSKMQIWGSGTGHGQRRELVFFLLPLCFLFSYFFFFFFFFFLAFVFFIRYLLLLLSDVHDMMGFPLVRVLYMSFLLVVQVLDRFIK